MTAGTTFIRGGRLIDPSRGIDRQQDLLISDGVVQLDETAPALRAGAEEFDAKRLIVVPGLVDIHSHFFYGMTSMAVDPRTAFHTAGTVVAADAGTSGSANFVNLRTFILEPAHIHLYAFINIYVLGMAAGAGDSFRHLRKVDVLDLAKVEPAAKMIARHRDRIVGVKFLAPHADREFFPHTAELLRRTREVAEMSGTRVMCHIDGGAEMETILGPLQTGDIITHAFHNKEPNIFASSGEIRPEVETARDRGVLFDFAPADYHHFSWQVLEKATACGFWPDTISTDVANPARGESPFATMPDCMSMLLHVGMPLSEVVAAATTRAAAALGLDGRHGSLAAGRAGDVTVLELVESPKTFRSMGEGGSEERTVSRHLVPVAAAVAGNWLWRSDRTEAT